MARSATLVLLALLLIVGQASAECAWVLWAKHEHWVSNPIEAIDEGAWEPRSTYKTLKDCEAGIGAEWRSIQRTERIGEPITALRCFPDTYHPRGRERYGVVRCLPDTVDPRGPKEK